MPEGPGVRVDSGIAAGSVIGADYDPMLAKLIAHGPDRATAIGRLDRALADLTLLGVAHNAAFSRALIGRDDFRAGEMDTGLLERVLDGGDLGLGPPADLLAAGALALWLEDTGAEAVAPGPGCVGSPAVAMSASARLDRDRGRALAGAGPPSPRRPHRCRARRRRARLRRRPRGRCGLGRTRGIRSQGRARAAACGRRPRARGPLEAPMPGKVLAVEVANGDRVDEGDVLLILESMKMELQIAAPQAGIVAGLELAVGDQVTPGQVLVAVDDAPARSRTRERRRHGGEEPR